MLLFLLPPSCMVAPIRKSANIFPFSSTNFSSSTTAFNINTSLPAISTANDIGMDIQSRRVPTNNPEVQGRNLVSSVNISRESLMASSGRPTPYHKRMDIDIEPVPTIQNPSMERLELSYEAEQEKESRVGMAANHQETSRPQNVNNEAFPSHAHHKDDVINIQLLYDPQALTKLKIWSGSFHPISLYEFVEHFTSDSKNIKITLNFLAKYIQNK